ncbi:MULTISPECIES: Tab2/Atab2 family RNA-binding protein [unclassified Coleofasciculus]|uniref:Tab2/Atab2 family RNA-binding protein n=1 Tax=unclassified Coleofasciculus TaxID=2692782 RepID=UPI0018818FED|nr:MULTISPECIES: Tab2/Atab2 family RNA-binding protein [unclassified Coleofasciculus]MBE9125646.1 Tab2/Atab2 family RNA-binding protein [Coleofasciculus sp. LEGE 07081]MBE9148800.1 Tab2/Atab2 family RNA-binding protein [Coleofasciculus sp. LEGE 07092]
MKVWQADFYRRPLRNTEGQVLWELFICDAAGEFTYNALCPQSSVNRDWLLSQLQQVVTKTQPPTIIQVFRPESLNLLADVGRQLGIKVEGTRHTPVLKQKLQERVSWYKQNDYYTGEAYNPTALDKPPPVPLPENLWGDRWRFATIAAGELEEVFAERPIPILQMPDELLPLNLGLPSMVAVPGVVIDGGRKSMLLARWLQDAQPVALNFIAGAPDGLILEAGLVERWVVATFEDKEVAAAGRMYEQRKQMSGGLHFLLVQPDELGMTYTGFWLLKIE